MVVLECKSANLPSPLNQVWANAGGTFARGQKSDAYTQSSKAQDGVVCCATGQFEQHTQNNTHLIYSALPELNYFKSDVLKKDA